MEKRIKASRIESVPQQRHTPRDVDYSSSDLPPSSISSSYTPRPARQSESSIGSVIGWTVGGIFALIIFIGMLGGGSGSSSSSSRQTRETAPDIRTHEDYLNATEREREDWADRKAKQMQDGGFNRVSGKDIKDGLDAFYSE